MCLMKRMFFVENFSICDVLSAARWKFSRKNSDRKIRRTKRSQSIGYFVDLPETGLSITGSPETGMSEAGIPKTGRPD